MARKPRFHPSSNPQISQQGEGGKGVGVPSKTEIPSNSSSKDTNIITVYRLDIEVYNQLEKQLGHIQVGINSNVHDVAYQLGIQKVLQVLREGIVIGT